MYLKIHNPNAIAGVCDLHQLNRVSDKQEYQLNRVIDVMSKEVDSFEKVVAFCSSLLNIFL